jgi:hypothetical protein
MWPRKFSLFRNMVTERVFFINTSTERRPDRNLQDMAHCVPTASPVNVAALMLMKQVDRWQSAKNENILSPKQDLAEKNRNWFGIRKNGDHVSWKEASILQAEPNNVCRKFKELATWLVWPIRFASRLEIPVFPGSRSASYRAVIFNLTTLAIIFGRFLNLL